MQSVIGVLKWTLVVLSLIFFLIVSIANSGTKVFFKLLPNTLEWQDFPVSSLILLLVALSYILFFLIGLFDNFENFLEKRNLKKRIHELENELKELRNEPIRKGSETDTILQGDQKI